MKTIKKLNLFIILLITSRSTFSYNSETISSQIKNSNFLPYTTQEYFYTKTSTQSTAKSGIKIEPTIISDVTSMTNFTTKTTRELIIEETKDGITTTTIETWVSKNPSYLTWNSGLLIAITASFLAFNFLDVMHHEFLSDRLLSYLLTDEKYKAKIIATLICDKNLSDKDIVNISMEIIKNKVLVNIPENFQLIDYLKK